MADTIILFTSDNGPWLGNQEMNGHTYSMSRYNGSFRGMKQDVRGMKQDVLEGGIRVPAIIRWPDGLSQYSEVNEMIHFTDWLPTLLAGAGVDEKSGLSLDGMCVLPFLRGEKGDVCKRFWQFNRYEPIPKCNGAMRDGDWKLYLPRILEAMAKLSVDNIWYQRMFREPYFVMDIDRSPVKRALQPASKPELYNIQQDHDESMDLSEKYPDRLANHPVLDQKPAPSFPFGSLRKYQVLHRLLYDISLFHHSRRVSGYIQFCVYSSAYLRQRYGE